RERSPRLRVPPARADPPVGCQPRHGTLAAVVVERSAAALEPHRDQQLSRPADDHVGDRLTQVRGAAVDQSRTAPTPRAGRSQLLHRRPVLNTEAFGEPPDDARRTVLDPASPGTAAKLAFLGVTAIVTHRNALRYTDVAKDVPNASWGPGYRLVARTGDGSSV